ncbi:MAG: T9SS type A sorting domain-containing protein [Bacteroidota bacterium]|nr:T9SS type A sorting domain-containing protein [Bacteroidota bacterium]
MKQKKDNNKIDHNLKAYSALAIGILAIAPKANGQIIYNDITPDTTIYDTNYVDIDIDLNGYSDFSIYKGYGMDDDSNRTVEMVGLIRDKYCEVLGSTAGSYFYPLAMNMNDFIDPNSPNWKINDFGTMNFQASYGGYGNWQGVQNKFLGIRVEDIDSSEYYGWVRLDVSANAKSFTLKDYAFNSSPDSGIKAGEGLTGYEVQNLVARDKNDNGDASDMKISFDKAVDESKISEYRLLIIKLQDSYGFSVADANSVSSGNYIKISKTGNNHSLSLAVNATDIEGNPIAQTVFYRIYILSVADGVNAKENILSTSNKGISVLHIKAPKVTDITASDVGNKHNGMDLRIEFDKVTNESMLSGYWIFVVKSAKANNFNIIHASMVDTANVTKLQKTASNIDFNLKANSKDSDGDLIIEDQPYKIFVVSLANGINATLHSLSEPSNEITLKNTSSINDKFTELDINIFSKNNYIVIESQNTINAEINIYTSTGKVVFNSFLKGKSKTINLPNARKGIYFVNIISNKGSFTKEILIR